MRALGLAFSTHAVVIGIVMMSACSHGPQNGDAGVDGGTCTATSSGGLAGFCTPSDPGGGGVIFAASGETLAITGYPFPPANAGDPAFVDGWDVRFDRVLVTLDKITLSSNPDLNPGDESQTGVRVAEVDGPWAIDLAHAGPNDLPGKGGGGERAVPVAALAWQNQNGNQSFATDGTRYAFGYDLVAATQTTTDGRATKNVNLDDAALADYAQMIANGCVVYYAGTATFNGTKSDAHCNDDPVFATWPTQVKLSLCFKSPSSYVNCQNPDNDPAAPLANDEHERGIAFLSNQSVIGQVTVHTDHPFWDSVLHDSPAHFDQLAARAAGQADAGATPVVTLDSMKGVDYTQITDALGNPLKWRYCIPPPVDVHPRFDGIMSFDPESVSHAVNGDPGTGLRDYYDFSTYVQSTQGHLDSDGLCYVKRNYPSPP